MTIERLNGRLNIYEDICYFMKTNRHIRKLKSYNPMMKSDLKLQGKEL